MKIISLFSGAGGLDLGLQQAGNNIIWANDIDPDAVATYRKNIGNHIVEADIKDLDIDSLPNADVVVGGFPCQGFSMANMRRNIDDERNFLYVFFYKTIKQKQPKFFIAEKPQLALDYYKQNQKVQTLKPDNNSYQECPIFCETQKTIIEASNITAE